SEESFEKFEVNRSTLPMVGLLALNTRLFGEVDDVIKKFLTPIMLAKQRLQMNQSVCYDVTQIIEWQSLSDNDIEEVNVRLCKQEQDICQ
ncbi:9348_t:CDS:2, partial [Ambispora leptoticha]